MLPFLLMIILALSGHLTASYVVLHAGLTLFYLMIYGYLILDKFKTLQVSENSSYSQLFYVINFEALKSV